jgi:hypothetical protein
MRAAQANTPLQALLHNAPLCESVAADFKKGTWTFKANSLQATAAGNYVILPAVVARLALEQEAACASAGVQLPPAENAKCRFRSNSEGQVTLSIEGDNGYEHDLYRDYQPNERTAKFWNAAHWRGHEERKDASGKSWRSMATYVQDDFGDLVEVSS